MVHKVIFWTGFGLAVNFWRLGIEMRPLFNRTSLWNWPLFAGAGASFGYWLDGVDKRQQAILEERKQTILEKRARRAAREKENLAEA
ncbi:NADH-ubiquinone oxidoreductase [Xylariaceae sp. FL0804]|nr:NADH-ubiquinone oxidoreductase [Xylariaceae sp. FL0804]